jgi:hypothetical protein
MCGDMAALQLPQADGIYVLLVWSGLVLLGLAAMRALLDWGHLLRETRGRLSVWTTRVMAIVGAALLAVGLVGWLLGS